MKHFTPPHGELLIADEAYGWVESLLTTLASPEFAARFAADTMMYDDDEDDFLFLEGNSLQPYRVSDGVLTIPVKGMLMAGLPYALGGMATGYEYIIAAIERGLADPEVREIVLDVNSPGGTVPGCFDCADRIYEARGVKPIRAVANEAAYSAAYAIASSADSVQVARTGGVGSIGVMTGHTDRSEEMRARGLKFTAVTAGKYKDDGSPYSPLSAHAEAGMQARVNAIHTIFVATVARNRGMDEQTVRDTEAACFMAQEAVELGLADAVGPLGKTSAFADTSNEKEDENMTTHTMHENTAAQQAAITAATSTGTTAGASAERVRISAIMDSEVAKTRPAAARHTALNSDMSVESATAFLAGLPEEAKTPTAEELAATAAAAGAATEAAATQAAKDAAANSFAGAMGSDNPDLGAGEQLEADSDEDFLKAYRATRS